MSKKPVTWNEVLRHANAMGEFRAALTYISEVLKSELTTRYDEMTLHLVPVVPDLHPELATLDIAIIPAAHNAVAQTMEPYGICQAELLRIPSLLVMEDRQGVPNIRFGTVCDRDDMGDQPIRDWCVDVVERAIRGTIRVRYWDPLNCICDTLDQLPAGLGEDYLRQCANLSVRGWSVVSNSMGRSLANAYEARDAMSAFIDRLGTQDPWDYLLKPNDDCVAAERAAWKQFQAMAPLWSSISPKSIFSKQDPHKVFQIIWDALLHGSRGPRFYRGVPSRFNLSVVYFDKSTSVVPVFHVELLDTSQTLQLLYEDLPTWYSGPRPGEPSKSRLDEKLSLCANIEGKPYARHVCLVSTWRDGTGTQYRSLTSAMTKRN